jgi:hypothetical protein
MLGVRRSPVVGVVDGSCERTAHGVDTWRIRLHAPDVSNEKVLPGFDEPTPELHPSWGTRIAWHPLEVVLTAIQPIPNCLLVSISGEVDAFNGSYLGGRLAYAIRKGFIRLILELKGAWLGDYRETLVLGPLRQAHDSGGDLVIVSPPKSLLQYYEWVGMSVVIDQRVADSVAVAIDKMAQLAPVTARDLIRKAPLRADQVMPYETSCPWCGQKVQVRDVGGFRCIACRGGLTVRRSGELVIDVSHRPPPPTQGDREMPFEALCPWCGWKVHVRNIGTSRCPACSGEFTVLREGTVVRRGQDYNH